LSGEVAPVPNSTGGIQVLITDTFKLHCFGTETGLSFHNYLLTIITGVKFYITAEPNTSNLDQILKVIYDLYIDYVLKVNFSANKLL
jgi:hypothetical protein